MATRDRNEIKPREKRLSEVFMSAHLKAGQADGQAIVFGCDPTVGGTNTAVTVLAGEVLLAGQSVVFAQQANQAIPAGAATAAGRFRKVLVEQAANGAVTMTPGVDAADQNSALLPAGDPSKIVTGWLELPASFVPGTTVVTAGMCKSGRTLYHA